MATKSGRKTVLLSHHQLFTAYNEEGIEDNPVNPKLLPQVQDGFLTLTSGFGDTSTTS